MPLAAGRIAQEIANIVKLERHSFLLQPRPFATPISEHVLLVPK
jgi:hypothetical protein